MSSLFRFTPVNNKNLMQPKDIIQEQCEALVELTQGLVIAKIEKYDGPIESYNELITKSLSSALTQSFNVQNQLGDISEGHFKYEFFITSKHTTNFKYRVLFLDYGLTCYPAKIVLDETIAEQVENEFMVDIDDDHMILCNSETEFKTILEIILNSEKMQTVINNLFTINRQEEKKNF